jgi:hypothetical protein
MAANFANQFRKYRCNAASDVMGQTTRPRRISLTSTVTPDDGLLRGKTRRARSAMSLAMSVDPHFAVREGDGDE